MKKLLSIFVLAAVAFAAQADVTLLSDANALQDNSEFTFNGNAVVTLYKTGYQNVNYMFLRDESGFSMIAGVEGTFENGQVLNQGWNATKTSVNSGWVRYINATGLSASGETNAELAAPIVLTTFPDESLLNAYVVIENTEVSTGTGGGIPGLPSRAYTLPDGTTITKEEALWGMDGEASGGKFNVYGVIIKHRGTLKINPVGYEPYVEPQPTWKDGDVNHDGEVDVDDVALTIRVVLGQEVSVFFEEQANLDDDPSKIDVGDVTRLINIVLGKN